MSLCLIFQAVVWVTPSRRPNSMLEIPPLLWERGYIARNQVHSGTLVAAKMVPAIKDVCRRQAVHWYSARVLTTLGWLPPQTGQTKQDGQHKRLPTGRHRPT